MHALDLAKDSMKVQFHVFHFSLWVLLKNKFQADITNLKKLSQFLLEKDAA